jgi:hypothetical protein
MAQNETRFRSVRFVQDQIPLNLYHDEGKDNANRELSTGKTACLLGTTCGYVRKRKSKVLLLFFACSMVNFAGEGPPLWLLLFKRQ